MFDHIPKLVTILVRGLHILRHRGRSGRLHLSSCISNLADDDSVQRDTYQNL